MQNPHIVLNMRVYLYPERTKVATWSENPLRLRNENRNAQCFSR